MKVKYVKDFFLFLINRFFYVFPGLEFLTFLQICKLSFYKYKYTCSALLAFTRLIIHWNILCENMRKARF